MTLNKNEYSEEYLDLLTTILDCGYADVKYLIEKMITLQSLTKATWEDIENKVIKSEDIVNVNNYLYGVLEMTQDHLFDSIRDTLVRFKENGQFTEEKFENLEAKLNELNENTSIYVNYLDSSFENFLDDVDMTQASEKIEDDAWNRFLLVSG